MYEIQSNIPLSKLRFNSRCKFSLFSVPWPGLIPDKHPRTICFLRLSSSFISSSEFFDGSSDKYGRCKTRNVARLSKMVLGSAVSLTLLEPKSFFCLKISPKSLMKFLAFGHFLELGICWVILFTAWNKSNLIFVSAKNFLYKFAS